VAADRLEHSMTIADKHYRQTAPDHFAKALQPCYPIEQHTLPQLPRSIGGSNRNERQVEGK
jgi:hypothetical protein